MKIQGIDFAARLYQPVLRGIDFSVGGNGTYINLKYTVDDFFFGGVRVHAGLRCGGLHQLLPRSRDGFEVRANAYVGFRIGRPMRATYKFVQGAIDDRCPALPAPCTTTPDGFATNFGRKAGNYEQDDRSRTTSWNR